MHKGDEVELNPAVEVFVFGLLLLDMAAIGRPEHSGNDYVAHVATEQFDWNVSSATHSLGQYCIFANCLQQYKKCHT